MDKGSSKLSNSEWLKWAVVIILFMLSVVSAVKGVVNASRSSIDFLYDDFHNAFFRHEYYNAQFPFTFWMMFFFAMLSAETAKNVWIACNLIFTIMLIIFIRMTFLKDMDGIDYGILLMMMLSGGAWRTNISNGQYKLLFLACFLLAVLLSEKDNYVGAGLFLSMSAFQYTLAVPMGVYFLFKREYKVIASAIAFLSASFIGSAIWFRGIKNITLKQLEYSRMLTEEGDVDLQSLLGLGDYVLPIFLAGVFMLVIMAYVIKWRQDDDTLFLSITVMTAYAVAYQRIYSFFILIIPLGFLWIKIREDPGDRLYFAGFSLMLSLTLVVFYSRTVSEYYGLLLSRVLFYPAYAALLMIAFRKGFIFTGNRMELDG